MANISFHKGNIFNTKMQTIVNTVNCVGVMGKGIALVFKLRYPEMFEKYKELCQSKMIGIGKLWLYKSDSCPQWVLNFPTKFHWKYPSKMEYIEAGLQKFVGTYKEKGITSIAFPLLGTHNGGLSKVEVLSLMYKYLDGCDIPIEIYEYDPLSPDDLFYKFRDRWNNLLYPEKIHIMGNRLAKQIEIIDKAINVDQVQSMISLIEYKGIGFATIQKCFTYVISYTDLPISRNPETP